MPWLKDLVESNDSSLEVLPVQCLCEFLLHDIHGDAEPNRRSAERKQQVARDCPMKFLSFERVLQTVVSLNLILNVNRKI